MPVDTVVIKCVACNGPIEVDIELGDPRLGDEGNVLFPVTGAYEHQCPVTGNLEMGTVGG